jgi:hypothetical protein
MCRRHCVAAGGCAAKKHSASESAALGTSSHKGKEPVHASPGPLPAPSPRHLNSPQPAASMENDAVDMFSNPRYSSQMSAAFTQQYARQQELEKQRRATDAARMERQEKARHNVVVYGWAKVCATNT